jgi:hypothetical protein
VNTNDGREELEAVNVDIIVRATVQRREIRRGVRNL